MRKRILVDLILIVGALTLPWWIVCSAAIACLFVFENFFELLVLGIVIDGVYGTPTRLFQIPVIFSLSTGLVFIGGSFFKQRIKFYL